MKDTIKNGSTWTIGKKIYTVIDVIDDMVKYVVAKPGKSAKIKTKNIDDIKGLILRATNLNEDNFKSNEIPANIEAQVFMIKAEKLILRDVPLEKPLSDGTETVYCFSINKKEEFLVGKNPQDENPVWLSSDNFLKIVGNEFLKRISDGNFKIDTSENIEDVKKTALKAIRELRNK